MSARTCTFRLRRRVFWMVFIAAASLGRAETADPELRLVAYADGKTWRDFATENGQVVALQPDTGERSPLPANVRWRLDGDMKANAALFRFSPDYGIVTKPPDEISPAARTFAIVWSRGSYWAKDRLRGAVVIMVWLVDGKPEAVLPLAASVSGTRFYLAIHELELDERRSAGQPVLLLLSQNGFVAPQPLFSDPEAQRVMTRMYLGSPPELAEAVGRLKSVTVREAGDGATLLHLAAEAGNRSAVELLLRSGADRNLRTKWSRDRAIDWAAADGRRDVVRLLTAGQAKPDRIVDAELVSSAGDNGHLEIVMDLAELAPKAAAGAAALQAANFGRVDAVEASIARHGPGIIAKIPASIVANLLAAQNNRLIDLLLNSGFRADQAVSGDPLLVVAAEVGNEAALAALVRAGARVAAPRKDGMTALMVAAHRGLAASVKLLLEAHADPGATNRDGLTALHLAAAANQGGDRGIVAAPRGPFDRPGQARQHRPRPGA